MDSKYYTAAGEGSMFGAVGDIYNTVQLYWNIGFFNWQFAPFVIIDLVSLTYYLLILIGLYGCNIYSYIV